jgi:hypothetical protein
MRQIVKISPQGEHEIMQECESLEESLQVLQLRREFADYDEHHYIGYDDVTLKLEDWEEEWIELCAKQDRKEREELIAQRRSMGLDLSDLLDDTDGEDYEYEDDYDLEEYNMTYYDLD